MANDLKSRIVEDTKACMRAQDIKRLGVLRLINAAIKQVEVDTRSDLNDDGLLGVLEKMLKQRRESLEQFTKANRSDLAAQESFEIEVIEAYMPAALPDEEINKLINDAITTIGATSMKDMGKIMGLLKPALKGRADMRVVSAKIKEHLT